MILEKWTIAKDCGYEIIKEGERVRFLNRDVLGLELAALFFTVTAAACAIGAVAIYLTTLAPVRFGDQVKYLGGAAIFFGVVGVVLRAAYASRRDIPADRAPVLFIADIPTGALMNAGGERIARLQSAKIDIRHSLFGYSEHGRFSGARWSVHLTWPTGTACVLKTMTKIEAKRVQRSLWQSGLGSE